MRIRFIITALLLMLFGCDTGVLHKVVVKQKIHSETNKKSVISIEDYISKKTGKKYDGHTIFALNLLGIDKKNNNFTARHPHVSYSKYIITTKNYSDGFKNKYSRNYIKKIATKYPSNKLLRKALNQNSNKKIRELQTSVRRLYKKFKLHRIKHTNPLRVSIAKIDNFLYRARRDLSKLSLDQKLLILRKTLNAFENIPVGIPLENFRVTSRFKMRWHPIKHKRVMHKGLDLVGKKRTPIYATANGVVTFAGRQRGYGKTVEIKHGKGSSTLYGHLGAIFVSEGERVVLGQPVALQGNTGSSTSDHLHYETRLRNQQVNPEIFARF